MIDEKIMGQIAIQVLLEGTHNPDHTAPRANYALAEYQRRVAERAKEIEVPVDMIATTRGPEVQGAEGEQR